MSSTLSPNAQAILLLTAPLIARGAEASADLLSLGEYNRLARFLRENRCEPADLIGNDRGEVVRKCQPLVDGTRLERLLGRGFLLSQVVEAWRARAIWIVSRADSNYPRRLKTRLKEEAPPIIYGCGEPGLLDAGGLAVVGSRNANDDLIRYAEEAGRVSARAGCVVVSGGARGIDQAGIRGALGAGGRAVGVLADSLERVALSRDHREPLLDERLVLMCPYDPAAGFNVGHAMQRNKIIYALADAALVVNADYESGGTWAGAVEQLQRWHFVPIYVRSAGRTAAGLEGLARLGAKHWPEPESTEDFKQAVATQGFDRDAGSPPEQEALPFGASEPSWSPNRFEEGALQVAGSQTRKTDQAPPADELYAKVKELIWRLEMPKTEAEVATALDITRAQAKSWLRRLVKEGALQKLSKPVRYRAVKDD
jgi:DNA processing protein